MILYSLKHLADDRYMLAKFDDDFNVAATYNLERKGFGFSCDCPASHRNKVKPCKHQRAMAVMLPNVDTDKFFEMETGKWHEPLADPGVSAPRDPALATSEQEAAYEAAMEDKLENGGTTSLTILKEITLPEGTEPSEVAAAFANLLHADEGPEPSPLTAANIPSPSKDESPSDRGQPAPAFKRRF